MNRPLLQNIYCLATLLLCIAMQTKADEVKMFLSLDEVMADQKSDVRDVDNILIMMNTAMWSPIIS